MKAVSDALQAELVTLFFVCFNDRFLFFNGIQNFRLFEMTEFIISTEVLSQVRREKFSGFAARRVRGRMRNLASNEDTWCAVVKERFLDLEF